MKKKWSKEVKKLTKKKGLDIVADLVEGDSFNQALKCMNWYGKAIVLGFAGGSVQKIKANRVLLKNIDIVGVAFGATAAYKDFPTYRDSVSSPLKMYGEGLLKPIIGKVYSLTGEGVKGAFEDLMHRKSVGKLIIRVKEGQGEVCVRKSKL